MLTTLENQLQRATPESQGIPSSAILRFVEAVESQIHEFHSFMLLRHGKVVAEGWWSPYGPTSPHMLFSLSKSFTSTAVGLAASEGHFSIDDPVLSFFPDERPAEVNEHLAAMRVRHLLSMSTGHADDTMPHLDRQKNGNWTQGFFDVPVVYEPGTHFLYNTGATYMLSAIVQKTTGQKLIDYLKPRLYEPLGIDTVSWDESPQGISAGGFGMSTTTEAIARFGQLYLQKGVWNGRRLLPEGWVEDATAFHIANGDGGASDWAQGYGYQFWRCQHGAYRGDGAFGQYCVVMPEQDAVLAVLSGLGDMQQPLNLVWDILLPAMGTDALPDDPAAQETLSRKLSGLSMSPVAGATASPMVSNVSGRTYHLSANELGFETVALEMTDSGCTMTVQKAGSTQRINGGYGAWAQGETMLFNEPWRPQPRRTAASGAWTADDTFTMLVRLYETPFYQTMTFRFTGNTMTLETLQNVWFAPPETITVTGQPV
jgi:CubicO group peptidase (beta-lactamase class C family)